MRIHVGVIFGVGTFFSLFFPPGVQRDAQQDIQVALINSICTYSAVYKL